MWIALIEAAGLGDLFLEKLDGGCGLSLVACGKRWCAKVCSFSRRIRNKSASRCDQLGIDLMLPPGFEQLSSSASSPYST